MTASVQTPSSVLINTSATPTPTNVTAETRAASRPFCTKDSNWSTSVVMRVMIRPAISLS